MDLSDTSVMGAITVQHSKMWGQCGVLNSPLQAAQFQPDLLTTVDEGMLARLLASYWKITEHFASFVF